MNGVLMDDRLHQALLKAHGANDRGALVALYTDAADAAKTSQDVEKECFFLTHAWIFALEIGHGATETLHARLVRHGRV